MKTLTLLFIASLALAEPKAEPPRGEVSSEVPKAQFTFKSAPVRAPYALGLIKKENVRGFVSAPPSKEFLNKADVTIPPKFELSEYAPLSPVKDQKQCGSCVSFSVSSTVEDTYRVRGVVLPKLSNQYQLSCGKREWMCNGSFFERTADDYVLLNGNIADEKYPYVSGNGSEPACKGKVTETIAQIQNPRVINNSPKSLITALRSGYAVSVTVGADNTWMSYGGGVYNACTSAGTNHQIELVGYDCEGECVFDANGKLAAGKGLWKIKNSWSEGWGDNGYMWTKMTSRSGRLCNNLTEEAGIVDVGLPFPPQPSPTPTPVPPSPTPSHIPAWVYIVFAVMGVAIVALIGINLGKKKE